MRLLVIAGNVGKTPDEVSYSFIFDEIYRLSKRGIEVHAIRARVEEDDFSFNIHFHGLKRSNEFNIPYIWSLLKFSPVGILRNPKQIYLEGKWYDSAVKVANEFKVDIVHAHFAYPEGLVGLLSAKKNRKPLVITVHGYDVLTEPTARYGVRLSKRLNSLVKRVINSADTIVCNSTILYEEVRKIVRDQSKVHLIFNGVDLKRFSIGDKVEARKELGLPLDKFIVFTVRNHEPKYGIEFLIRAARYVVSQKKDVLFVIGGDGSLRRYHEELVRKLNIVNYFMFTGVIPQRVIHLYYIASDVVVVPSLQEAWGLVVTEALASGRPVIGSDIGGIKDQIIEGQNGFLVSPRNPLAIAERIVYFIDNPGDVFRMGMNGRRLAEEKFDIEKRIDKILKVYEKVLSGYQGV